jgi:hypothetical protein
MGNTEAAEQVWTKEEVAAFRQTLGTFREELPARQRDAFDAILAGAAQAAERGAGGDTDDEEAAAFAQTLGAFREGLPARQREAFNAIVAAGVAQLGASGDDVQGYVLPAFAVGLGVGSWMIIGVQEAQKAGAFDAIDVGGLLQKGKEQALKGKRPA